MNDLEQLAAHLEAVLFSSGDPLSPEKIGAALALPKKDILGKAIFKYYPKFEVLSGKKENE